VNDSEIYSDSFCADFLTGFLDELVSELHCNSLLVCSKAILLTKKWCPTVSGTTPLPCRGFPSTARGRFSTQQCHRSQVLVLSLDLRQL
jgi:hypothetical protein